MVDNYDSFTYNLVQYLGELGADVRVYRNDAITLDEVAALAPAQIVVSLIIGPLVALLYVIYARVILEVILAIFRLLESNREIAFLQRQQLALMQQQSQQPPAA